jgi:SAM-dependent methyltransferase
VTWYPAVAERDHDIQNPTSPAKIRQLGEWLRLGPESRVLDVACGRGGPSLVLGSTFGCRITGVERAPEFAGVARERVAAAGLDQLIEIVEADARDFSLEANAWDAALCLGATFVWDGLEGTLAALCPAVRPGGHVVVGEPFWRQPPPAGTELMGYVSLAGTVATLEQAGVILVGLIGASTDDWDRYESLHWRAVEDWLAERGADDADAEELRRENEQHKRRYVETGRDLLGWAILIGRRPG